MLNIFECDALLLVSPIKLRAVLLKGTYCQVLVLYLKNLTISASICSNVSVSKLANESPVKQANKNILQTSLEFSVLGIVSESCLISSKVKNCLSVSSIAIALTFSQGLLGIILSLTASLIADFTLSKCPEAVLFDTCCSK